MGGTVLECGDISARSKEMEEEESVVDPRSKRVQITLGFREKLLGRLPQDGAGRKTCEAPEGTAGCLVPAWPPQGLPVYSGLTNGLR